MTKFPLRAGTFAAVLTGRAPVSGCRDDVRSRPGKTFANVGDVPLESLTAGDTVLIYYRATPYKEKFVIAARRNAQRAGDDPRRPRSQTASGPILDGNGATTRAQLNYPSRVRGRDQDRRVRGALCRRHLGHAAMDRDREPRDPRRAQPQHVHRSERRHRDLHRSRLRDLRRVRREHHRPQLRHEQQRQRLLRVLFQHHRQPQHPGRGELHPRQRERRQQLRAQRLRGGDRRSRFSTTTSARCFRAQAATTSRTARPASSSATTGSSTRTGSSISCTPRTARWCAPIRAIARRTCTGT